jgi:Zn-dependent protease with chaperone function
MDFFENQERAQRNTGRLVVLFVLGLVATVASTHLLVSATVGGGRFGDPGVLALSLGSSLAIVALGAGVKFAQMSQGGRAVAEAVGGRQIDPGSSDPDERRVLNVVEEMAIASGVRVPPVYILEDDGINAFAAGNSQQDSVIAVTRGCVRELTRDELQGVVAHEFSHIFHRDTVLNMRLVGFLGGICAISLVGRTLLRFGGTARSSRDRNGGGVAMLGLGLFLIGICGYFFGRIIQCAVSRQREFLADASAVQYTRNPDGIAGALEKIAAGAGSRLAAPAAAEFSHFYFAQGVASIFADHPPLAERIARIRGVHAVAAGVNATRGGAAIAGAAAVAGTRADVVTAASLRSARGAMRCASRRGRRAPPPPPARPSRWPCPRSIRRPCPRVRRAPPPTPPPRTSPPPPSLRRSP